MKHSMAGAGRSAVAPDVSAAFAAYDELGDRLHLLAGLLTGDSRLSAELVVEAVVAQTGPPRLQVLSASVYRTWTDRRDRSWTVADGDWRTDVVGQVHRLPADNRAALALCKHGGHDYRGAAAIMGLSPERVARLLLEALRILGTARADDVGPTSAA